MKKYRHHSLPVALVALAAGVFLAPPGYAVEPTDPTKHYAGIGVGPASSADQTLPFADMIHLARRWATVNDAAGFPTTDFYAPFETGKTNSGQLTVNGTYTLQFTGQATVTVTPPQAGRVTITGKTWNPTTNITTATVTAAYADNPRAPNQIDLNFTATKRLPTDPAGNGLTNISLVNNTTPLPAMTAIYQALKDADEWPTTDARIFVNTSAVLPLGVYKLQFTGQAVVTDAKLAAADTNTFFTITAQSYNPTTHTTTADLTLLQPGTQARTIHMIFSDTHRFNGTTLLGANTGVTNVRLWRPGYTVAPNAPISAASTPLFSTDHKTMIGKAQVIRFMDWCSANDNPISLWSDRTRPAHAIWARGERIVTDHEGTLGVPYEVMVRLCNETNADLYITVPVLADVNDPANTYVTNLAKLIRYGSDGVNPYSSTQANPVWAPLNAALKVYVEYGNETWNTAPDYKGYPWTKRESDLQLADTLATGTLHPINFDGEPSPNILQNRYCAYRITQISDVFRAVFGDAAMMTRVRPLFLGQKGAASPTPGPQLTAGLTFLDKFYGAVNPFNPTPRPVSRFLYGGGGSAYYGVINESADPAVFFAAGNWPEPDFPKAILTDALWVGNLGLKRIAYEGGMGLGNTAFYTGAQAAALNADPRMQPVVQDYHDAWTASGGDLLVYYELTGATPWAFTPDFTQPNSPKLQALTAIVNTRPRATLKAGATFSGSPLTATSIFRDGATIPVINSGGLSVVTDVPTGELLFGNFTEGKWIAFGASVPSTGIYQCKVRYRLTGTTPTTLEIYVNGALAVTMPPIAGQTTAVMTDSPVFDLPLTKGLAVIRVQRKLGSGGSTALAMRSSTLTFSGVPDVTAGLRARWNFDANTNDTSPTDPTPDTGTAVGSPTYTTAGVPVGTHALSLSGTGQYINVTGYTGVTGTAARTCTAWVKTSATGTIVRPIIAWGTNVAGTKWNLAMDGPGRVRVEVGVGSIVGTTVINDGQWHHVACTFSPDATPNVTDVKLYVDGALQAISASSAAAINTATGTTVQIGRSPQNVTWSGQLDDVRVYTRALSQTEIANVFSQM